jgi:hypothetical protein
MATRRFRTLVPLTVALIAGACTAAPSSSAPARLDSQHQFCPAGSTRPARENPRSAEVLVPMAPRELLVCRYYGLNEPPSHPAGTLAAEGLLRRTAPTRSLAREFDALEPFPDRPLHCPADDGSALLAIFRYRSQPEVPVRVNLTGCRGATNDRLRQTFFLSGRLQDRLEALAPLS